MKKSQRILFQRGAFTLVELLVLVAAIGVVLGILFPAIQSAREDERATQCAFNLKKIALAIHNFHDVHQHMPPIAQNNEKYSRVNWAVMILPYIDQASLWTQYANGGKLHMQKPGDPTSGRTDKECGPYRANPWDWSVAIWYKNIEIYHCPADSHSYDAASEWFPGRLNYRASLGDASLASRSFAETGAQSRGPFMVANDAEGNLVRRLSSVVDGTSNTAMFSECLTHPTTAGPDDSTLDARTGILTGKDPRYPETCMDLKDPDNPERFQASESTRPWSGRRWADGLYVHSSFNTILPPNAASCISGTRDDERSIMTASSGHAGGVNVVLVDGSVRFISDAIDCGDLTADNDQIFERVRDSRRVISTNKSPYGVWGSFGSINGGESVILDF